MKQDISGAFKQLLSLSYGKQLSKLLNKNKEEQKLKGKRISDVRKFES